MLANIFRFMSVFAVTILEWTPESVLSFIFLGIAFVFGGFLTALYAGVLIAVNQYSWVTTGLIFGTHVTFVLARDYFLYAANRFVSEGTERITANRKQARLQSNPSLFSTKQVVSFVLQKVIPLTTIKKRARALVGRVGTFDRQYVGLQSWSGWERFWKFFGFRTWYFPLGMPMMSLAGFVRLPLRKIILPTILGQVVFATVMFGIGYLLADTIRATETYGMQIAVAVLSASVVVAFVLYNSAGRLQSRLWKKMVG